MCNKVNKKPVIVFGLGSFSNLMTRYIQRFTDWQIEAYTVDDEYCTESTYLGKPVIAFSAVKEKYPPQSYDAFVAVGYSSMGETRKNAFLRLKEKGFQVRNFQHPDSSCSYDVIGEGNIILENATVSIGTSLADGNLVWCNSNIAHDCCIGSFNTFCGSSAFGGFTVIKDNCFFGINSTCKDGITIDSYTFVGASAYLSSDTKRDDAFIPRSTQKTARLSSKSVMRFLGE